MEYKSDNKERGAEGERKREIKREEKCANIQEVPVRDFVFS